MSNESDMNNSSTIKKLYQKGYELYYKKNFLGAIKCYTEVIKENSLFLDESYYSRGSCYRKLKQFSKSIADYTSAIEINPNFTNAYNNRGNAYSKMKKFQLAINDYTKASELKSDINIYVNRGNAYDELRDYENAIKDITKAIEMDKKNITCYYNRGNAYYKNKEYENAIKDFNRCIEFDENFSLAYYSRGACKEKMNNFEISIEDYTRVIEINPLDSLTYSARAGCYGKIFKYVEAIRDCNKAIKMAPETAAEAYVIRGAILAKINKFEKSVNDLTTAIKINPTLYKAYHNRSYVYMKTKRFDLAIQDTKKSVELDPKFDSGHYTLGLLLKREMNFHQSIKSFSTCIKITEDEDLKVLSYVERAYMYKKLKMWQKSVADFLVLINKVKDYRREVFLSQIDFIKNKIKDSSYKKGKETIYLGYIIGNCDYSDNDLANLKQFSNNAKEMYTLFDEKIKFDYSDCFFNMTKFEFERIFAKKFIKETRLKYFIENPDANIVFVFYFSGYEVLDYNNSLLLLTDFSNALHKEETILENTISVDDLKRMFRSCGSTTIIILDCERKEISSQASGCIDKCFSNNTCSSSFVPDDNLLVCYNNNRNKQSTTTKTIEDMSPFTYHLSKSLLEKETTIEECLNKVRIEVEKFTESEIIPDYESDILVNIQWNRNEEMIKKDKELEMLKVKDEIEILKKKSEENYIKVINNKKQLVDVFYGDKNYESLLTAIAKELRIRRSGIMQLENTASKSIISNNIDVSSIKNGVILNVNTSRDKTRCKCNIM